ncbi:hypothetical protein BH10BAC5_BH10BAC5_16950 [soil metagenome]
MHEIAKIEVRGHELGIISDGDIRVRPDNCFVDSYNLDTFPGYDQMRKPISIYMDLSSVLPAGYSVLRYFEKTFSDASGNNVNAMIVIAVKSGEPAKIYISKYFNPSTDFGNNFDATPGWKTQWTELTETYTHAMATNANVNGNGLTVTITDGTLPAAADYYKGWFVKWNGLSAGIVLAYSKSGSTGTFKIFKTENIDSGSQSNITLSRFPHNLINNWTTITEAHILDQPNNSIKIACGYTNRPLFIGLLNEKKFFGDAPDQIYNDTVTDFTYKRHWNGIWMEFDTPLITEKKLSLSNSISTQAYNALYAANTAPGSAPLGGFRIILGVPISSTTLHVGDNVTLAGFTTYSGVNPNGLHAVTYVQASSNWFEIARLSGPNTGFIAQTATVTSAVAASGSLGASFDELGIGLSGDYTTITVDADKNYNEFWDVALELDNFQTFFLKRIIGKADKLVTKRVQYYNSISFRCDFSRRLTKIANFYQRYLVADLVQPDMDKRTFLLSNNYSGIIELNTDGIYTLTASTNYYKIILNNYLKNSGSDFEKNPENESVSLNAYLGQKYYNDTNIKCKWFLKVGTTVVGLNLSDYDLTDTTNVEKISGKNKIAISNVQGPYEDINSSSCFSQERIKETTNFPITGGAVINDKTFVIFSEKEMIVYTIGDKSIPEVDEDGRFEYGALSMDGIAAAKIGDEYGGIYWNGPLSIYRYIKGYPESIAEHKIETAYQAYSSKETFKAGFSPSRKDIIFHYDYQTIWIFSIGTSSWKKYKYPAPSGNVYNNFQRAVSGELTFNEPRKILITEPQNTTNWRDFQTALTGTIDGTAIKFYLRKYISHGSVTVNKIFDKLELAYVTSTEPLSESIVPEIRIKISQQSGTGNDILRATGGIIDLSVNPIKNIVGSYFRPSAAWYNIIIDNETQPELLKSFQLTELIIISLAAAESYTNPTK